MTASAVILSALLAVISSQARATQEYSLSFLSIPGSTEAEAMAISTNGIIAGSAYIQGGSSRSAVFWPDGINATVLPSLGGSGRAFGVSSNGVIVGYGPTATSALRAISWNNGIPTDLPTLGGSTSGAYGVNGTGIVVGFADLTGNSKQHATKWTLGVPEDLGSLGGDYSVAYAINGSGAIAGYSGTSAPGVQRATLWTTAGPEDLGTLGGTSSFAFGINNSQQVVGWSYLAGNGGISRATLWSSGQILNLGSLGGSQSFAVAVNDAGAAVGASLLPGDSFEHAVLYQGSVATDLNIYLSAGLTAQGWYLAQARGISESGAIVGWARNYITGDQQGFFLSPIPELPTPALCAVGLFLLYIAQRARRQESGAVHRTEA